MHLTDLVNVGQVFASLNQIIAEFNGRDVGFERLDFLG